MTDMPVQRSSRSPGSWEEAFKTTCDSFEELTKTLARSKKDEKAKEAIPHLVDNFLTNCASLKKYKMKQEKSSQHDRLLKLFMKLDGELSEPPGQDPDWQLQLSKAKVALFWQVMYQLRAFVEASERAFVLSKRFRPGGRVEAVFNDPK